MEQVDGDSASTVVDVPGEPLMAWWTANVTHGPDTDVTVPTKRAVHRPNAASTGAGPAGTVHAKVQFAQNAEQAPGASRGVSEPPP